MPIVVFVPRRALPCEAREHGLRVRSAMRWVWSQNPGNFDETATPSVVFSDPPLAAVGMRSEEAAQRGADVTIKHTDTSARFTQRRLGYATGAAKIITETASGRIVGAHLLGVNADEIINVFALAVRHGLTGDDLQAMVRAYPTAGSDIAYLV